AILTKYIEVNKDNEFIDKENGYTFEVKRKFVISGNIIGIEVVRGEHDRHPITLDKNMVTAYAIEIPHKTLDKDNKPVEGKNRVYLAKEKLKDSQKIDAAGSDYSHIAYEIEVEKPWYRKNLYITNKIGLSIRTIEFKNDLGLEETMLLEYEKAMGSIAENIGKKFSIEGLGWDNLPDDIKEGVRPKSAKDIINYILTMSQYKDLSAEQIEIIKENLAKAIQSSPWATIVKAYELLAEDLKIYEQDPVKYAKQLRRIKGVSDSDEEKGYLYWMDRNTFVLGSEKAAFGDI
ncbi:MAG TPA: hypothetical protein DCL49_04275, partial [Candidatus Omnitrophica bacterium]|nr:hypothetical protein [Candidatus Omnitrophota bacterium]